MLPLEVAKINKLDVVIDMEEHLPFKRVFVRNSPFMRLVPPLTVLRAWWSQCQPGR